MYVCIYIYIYTHVGARLRPPRLCGASGGGPDRELIYYTILYYTIPYYTRLD